MRRHGAPPSAAEIDAIARGVLERLPEPFASRIADVVLQVEEFADEATLAEMGFDDPFELTGLYDGIDLADPDAPITDETIRTLVDEIGGSLRGTA